MINKQADTGITDWNNKIMSMCVVFFAKDPQLRWIGHTTSHCMCVMDFCMPAPDRHCKRDKLTINVAFLRNILCKNMPHHHACQPRRHSQETLNFDQLH